MSTYVELVFHQDPEFFFNKASACEVIAQFILMHGGVSSPGQNLEFTFVGLHEASAGSLLWLVGVPLNGSPGTQQIDPSYQSTQFNSPVCRLVQRDNVQYYNHCFLDCRKI